MAIRTTGRRAPAGPGSGEGDQPSYWNASFVYYGQGVRDRLAADIGAEVAAIQNYRAHQQMIADPNIQALLERIIMDEEHHLDLFRQASARYCPGREEHRT